MINELKIKEKESYSIVHLYNETEPKEYLLRRNTLKKTDKPHLLNESGVFRQVTHRNDIQMESKQNNDKLQSLQC